MVTGAQGIPTEGQVLFSTRQKLHLSQTEMAERLGLSLRAYQDLEKSATVRKAYKLATEFIAMQIAVERAQPELATPQGRTLAKELANARRA